MQIQRTEERTRQEREIQGQLSVNNQSLRANKGWRVAFGEQYERMEKWQSCSLYLQGVTRLEKRLHWKKGTQRKRNGSIHTIDRHLKNSRGKNDNNWRWERSLSGELSKRRWRGATHKRDNTHSAAHKIRSAEWRASKERKNN